MEVPRTAIVIFGVVVAMAIFSLAVHRAARRTDDTGIMTSPPVLFWAMAVATVFPGSIVVTVQALGLAGPLTGGERAILLAFAALGAYSTTDALITRVRLGDDGFAHRTLFQRELHVAWSEVKRVSYAPIWRHWVIDTDHDRRWIGVVLTNQTILASALLTHVPADTIEPGAADKLKQTADGNPPAPFH